MKKIEKIDVNKMDDLEIWLKELTDKVNSLIDEHNKSVKDQNISVCIDRKSMSTMVADMNSIKVTVTTLVAKEAKIDALSEVKLEIDDKYLKNTEIETINKGDL